MIQQIVSKEHDMTTTYISTSNYNNDSINNNTTTRQSIGYRRRKSPIDIVTYSNYNSSTCGRSSYNNWQVYATTTRLRLRSELHGYQYHPYSEQQQNDKPKKIHSYRPRSSTRLNNRSILRLGSTMFVYVICIIFLVPFVSTTLYIPETCSKCVVVEPNSDSEPTMVRATNLTSFAPVNAVETSSSSSSSASKNTATTVSTYETLPGLFGKYMVDDRIYNARIQYWPENPYLCSSTPHTSFRNSFGIVVPTQKKKPQSNRSKGADDDNKKNNDDDKTNDNTTTTSDDEKGNDNMDNSDDDDTYGLPTTEGASTIISSDGEDVQRYIPGDPIAVLVARGNCPFSEKALNLEVINPSIVFMIVYNTADSTSSHSSSTDDLIPMYSEYDTTRLVLFSVSHTTGQAIKHYIANQTYDVLQTGGPRIQLDSKYPPGISIPGGYTNGYSNGRGSGMNDLDMNNVQAMLISALGLFFLLLSCIGCVIIVVATYGQVRFVTNNGRVVVVMTTTSGLESAADDGGGGNGSNHPGTNNGGGSGTVATSVMNLIASTRRLLTVDEVYQLQQQSIQLQNQQSCGTTASTAASPTATATTGLISHDTLQVASDLTRHHHQHPLHVTTVSSESDDDDDNERDGDGPAHDDDYAYYDNCCSICLDDLRDHSADDIIVLPCHHKFHYSNCIVPWLTERQSKCPLCKYDVYQYVRNNNLSTTTGTTGTSTPNNPTTDNSNNVGDTIANTTTPSTPRTPIGLWRRFRAVTGGYALTSITPLDYEDTTTNTTTTPTSSTDIEEGQHRNHQRRPNNNTDDDDETMNQVELTSPRTQQHVRELS